jgi:hypothetical protein
MSALPKTLSAADAIANEHKQQAFHIAVQRAEPVKISAGDIDLWRVGAASLRIYDAYFLVDSSSLVSTSIEDLAAALPHLDPCQRSTYWIDGAQFGHQKGQQQQQRP